MFRIRLAVCAVVFALVGLAGCDVKFAPMNAPNPPPTSKATPGGGSGGPKEDPAETDLKRLNGKVTRDKAQPDNPVVAIRLFSADVTDDDLKDLAQFKSLKKLELSAPAVTGTGFAALSELPLEELNLMFAKGTTNDGMKEIAKIATLKVLYLSQGKHNDDGVKELAKLPNLEEITVSHGVNDTGFYPFKGHKKLRKVNANNCGVGDGAMKALAECPEMRVLELYGSAVTDLGYGYIGKMSKLEELRTSYGITDKGVAELGKLEKLRKLSVWNSSVTIKGVRACPT